MAATGTVRKNLPIGHTERLIIGSIALDNSYPTGGYALSLTGVRRIEALWPCGGSGAANGYDYEWDAAAQKAKAYRTDQIDDPQEEVPAATDLSAVTALQFVAIGK